MAIDNDGFVHAAFVRNGRVHYMTNRSGNWLRERVTLPDGHDSEPSIALDADGSVGIAFTRWAPEDPDVCRDMTDCFPVPDGVFYVTNKSGSWSNAELVERTSSSPSLAIRNGARHLAYLTGVLCGELCASASVHYRTDASGSWSDTEVGLTIVPVELAVGVDGTAYLTFADLLWDNDTNSGTAEVSFARVDGASGSVTVEFIAQVDQPAVWINRTLIALDGNDVAHVVAEIVVSDEGAASLYWTKDDGAWRRNVDPPRHEVLAVAADQAGTLHMVACCIAYAATRSGSFAEHALVEGNGPADIAVDAGGRPHILFVNHSSDSTTLWYAVGPAPN